jgi:Mrp family chromosome partitioning ATPase
MVFNRKKPSSYTILQTAEGVAANGNSTRDSNGNGARRAYAPLPTNGERGMDNSSGMASSLSTEETLALQIEDTGALLEFAQPTVKALRYMTTRLMVNDGLPQRVAVVAALREEGVTYSTLATAALLACDTPRRICYVDLNWWWPSSILSHYGRKSVAGVLQHEIDLDQALLTTNFTNLQLLPAGELPVKQRAMFARGAELPTLLGQLAERYDHLLLDIPAILTTSDAIPLASLADGCCPVVRQGVSTSSMVGQALKELEHLAMLGVIMNRVAHRTPEWLLRWIPQA